MNYISLSATSLGKEHICCAFSDRKCDHGTALKKQWLAEQFSLGYVFRRLNERAKVFIEYGPSELAWVPVSAPNTLMIGCFWVSGRYAGQGHGKALLQGAIDAARQQGRSALVTVVGRKKFHFLSDPKWLLRQGFTEVDSVPSGFSLLALPIDGQTIEARFNECTRTGESAHKAGIVAYYSHRCPFADFHVRQELAETCAKRGLELSLHRLDSREAAQECPSPATIFSLFVNGRFVTTDMSVCLDSRFDAIFARVGV